jgi:hypothetical protein
MAEIDGSSSTLPASIGMDIDPAQVELGPGQKLSLTARGASSKYPSMCPLSSVTWSADSLNGIATLDGSSANPVAVTGKGAGAGSL